MSGLAIALVLATALARSLQEGDVPRRAAAALGVVALGIG